jgi:hypothetical protein
MGAIPRFLLDDGGPSAPASPPPSTRYGGWRRSCSATARSTAERIGRPVSMAVLRRARRLGLAVTAAERPAPG